MKNREYTGFKMFEGRMTKAMVAVIMAALISVWGIVPSSVVFAEEDAQMQTEQDMGSDQGTSDAEDGTGGSEDGTGGSGDGTKGGSEEGAKGSEDMNGQDDQNAQDDQKQAPAMKRAGAGSEGSDSAGTDSTQGADEVTDPVACIGDQKFADLKSAIEAAKDGETIVIQKDFKDYAVVDGKTLTIDLNGHTWKAKGGSNIRFIKATGNSNVTLTNGTLTGSRAKNGEEAGVQNDGSEVTITNITATGNNGEVVRNANGILHISDCVFTENYATSTDWNRYIVHNRGANAKTDITNSQFISNDMVTGGTIYSYGDSYTSRSKAEMRLTSVDIKDNRIKGPNVNLEYNTHAYLNDTTISGNVSISTDTSATAGIRFGDSWIDWVDSASYNNSTPSNVYARDIYVRSDDINGGFIPLPADMKDHGKALTNYKMFDYRYSYEFTTVIDSSLPTRYTEIALEEDADTVMIAEYDGKEYPTVAKAIEAMNGKAGTVRILKDAKLGETIEGHDGIVIDLDGHTITAKNSSRSMFSITGGDITIKNGTVTGGGATVGSVIESTNAAITIENVDFSKNKNDAVYVRYGNDADPEKRKVNISNCTFTENGSKSGDYAVDIAECDSTISNCTFDGNAGGIRMYEIGDDGLPTDFVISDCVFKNGTETQLESYLEENSKATITNCDFVDNSIKDSECVIQIEQKSYGEPRMGGDHVFKNCNISGNSGSKTTTIAAETGSVEFDTCQITGNKAGNVGAIEADPFASLTLKNTIVKNNENTKAASTSSGGIALRSGYFTLISVGFNGSSSTSQDLGFYTAKLDMSGGAIYNNNNDSTSPAAQDLYVSQKCEINVPEVADMEDGDYDFTGLFWKDDEKTDVETRPETTYAANRFYSVGVPGGIKQVYVDGVNGDDSNVGTKESPVKTLEQAAALAEAYRSKCIMVLDTVTFSEGEKVLMDLGDVIIKRNKGFTGVLFDVAEGVELTIRNTVIDGNSVIYAPAKGSLVKVEKGASLILDDGAVLQNNGYSTSYNTNNGGGVYCLGDMIMNDGAMIYHNYGITGGGVCIESGTFVMNGGTIDDNRALWRTGTDYADSCGGGVAVTHGGYMEMKGGTISNNEGLKNGGGISLGTANATSVKSLWAPDLGISRLVMTGGTIEGNKAYTSGGGIFVQNSTEATIVGGTIQGNKAQGNLYAREGNTDPSYFAGGGIYVNGYHETGNSAFGLENGKLYLTNVEIANNDASWEGGALAVCGAGSGTVSELKGTVIYDNSSEGASKGSNTRQANGVGPGWNGNYDVLFDNVSFTFDYSRWDWNPAYEMETLEYESYLSDLMLNGAPYNWMDENGDVVSVEKINKHTVLNTDATASDPDVQASVAKATVHILGNHSDSNGGGIGCNGVLSIGQLPDYIDITVDKKWDDEGHEGERPDTIKLDLLRDGEIYDSRTISADENGDWNCVFAELPKYHTTKNGEQTKDEYEYTIREDMTYVPAERDESIATRYADTVEQVDDHRWEVTNAYMDVKGEEEEPEEPEEPPKAKVVEPDEEDTKATVKGAEDEPKSTKSGQLTNPGTRTGDNSPLLIVMILMLAAACGAAIPIYRKRRLQ